ncbi:MAG: hypothetical protein HDT27_00925 [Subdoligranulum sp.]|nr:hypothetical protein [Subdoligranulum sp.]
MQGVQDLSNYAWLIIVAIVAICVAWSQMKESKNKKLAQTGADMQRLKDAVARVLPGETGYNVVYAHHEDVQYYGRSTRTTYYAYAIAFDATRLWIIPIGFKKEEILPGKPYLASANTGMMDVNPTVKKGELKSISVTLRDKTGESPTFFDVDVWNTRKDRFHHVNVYQAEEAAQFQTFVTGMAETVAKENEDLKALMDEKAKKQNSKSGIILGILGILTCWTCIIGLIFGGVGLLCAPKPSETDGKAKAPYVLSLIATILSVFSGVMLLVVIFA